MEEQNMKTFGDVKTGDKIYTIDEDFRIRELYVCGVEDIRLAHSEMHLKTLSGATFKVYMKEKNRYRKMLPYSPVSNLHNWKETI